MKAKLLVVWSYLAAVAAPIWESHRTKIISSAVALITGFATYLLNPPVQVPGPVVEKEVVKLVPADPNLAPDDPRNWPNGWVDDQTQVKQMIAEMQPPLFSETPAGLTEDLPKQVFAWQFYNSLPIRAPPIRNQGQIGCCVGCGTTTAIERCLAAEIAAGKAFFEWSFFSEEVTYANSRVDIGGGGLRGDGSVGIWAAQAAIKLGMVPRQPYPTADLTNYNQARCRQWGASGTPSAIKAVGKQFPVKQTSQIKSWADAKAALANGYSFAVSSNVGFNNPNGTVGTRDSRGVIMPRGTWNHCMCCDGYYTDTDGKEYGHITNSWGANAHTGPVGWGNPGTDGFWTTSATIDNMVRQGDSWTFSGLAGFPRKKLPDGFIRHVRPEDNGLIPSGLAFLDRHKHHDVGVALAP